MRAVKSPGTCPPQTDPLTMERKSQLLEKARCAGFRILTLDVDGRAEGDCLGWVREQMIRQFVHNRAGDARDRCLI